MSRRKGFTLVELLIVIVVIGILAAGMMIAAGGATESAKAATAISELRNAKSGGMMWIAENPLLGGDDLVSGWTAIAVGTPPRSIDAYMDNIPKAQKIITSANTANELFIGTTAYDGESATFFNKVYTQGKGFVFFSSAAAGNTNPTSTEPTTGEKYIWMRVR